MDAIHDFERPRDQRMAAYSHLIKYSTLEAIEAHVTRGTPVGHFVTAVLSNSLSESFARADDDNRAAMFNIVRYLYNEVPAPAWGSPEKVRAWQQKHEGARAAAEKAGGS